MSASRSILQLCDQNLFSSQIASDPAQPIPSHPHPLTQTSPSGTLTCPPTAIWTTPLHPLGDLRIGPLSFPSVCRCRRQCESATVRSHVRMIASFISCWSQMSSLGLVPEDMANGLNEWRNIQEIVRFAFKALTEKVESQAHALAAQAEAISRLERSLEQKASRAETQGLLGQKASSSDLHAINRRLSDLNRYVILFLGGRRVGVRGGWKFWRAIFALGQVRTWTRCFTVPMQSLCSAYAVPVKCCPYAVPM